MRKCNFLGKTRHRHKDFFYMSKEYLQYLELQTYKVMELKNVVFVLRKGQSNCGGAGSETCQWTDMLDWQRIDVSIQKHFKRTNSLSDLCHCRSLLPILVQTIERQLHHLHATNRLCSAPYRHNMNTAAADNRRETPLGHEQEENTLTCDQPVVQLFPPGCFRGTRRTFVYLLHQIFLHNQNHISVQNITGTLFKECLSYRTYWAGTPVHLFKLCVSVCVCACSDQVSPSWIPVFLQSSSTSQDLQQNLKHT